MSTRRARVGMIVPSLNTIAEDDFRLFCPPEVRYHVHRIRLRKEGGRVTRESLARAHLEAIEEAGMLKDMSPDAVVFNCTGASVSCGPLGDQALADRMTRELGLPATNTMVAIKQALAALGLRSLVHVCPFADQFSTDERLSLEASGLTVLKSVGLNFVDAKEAALMTPARLAEIACGHMLPEADGLLLSCANVRAAEAAEAIEQRLGKPVVTSNQAVLWAVLRLVGHTAVRAAFEALLANGGVRVQPERARRIDAGGCSVHSVIERIEVMSDDGPAHAWVLATNVYAKTVHGWRMVAHHASPGSRNEPADALSTPPVLH